MDSLKECLIVFTNNFTARPLTDPMTVQGMNLVVGGNVQRFLVQWSGSVHIRPPTRHCRIEKSCDSPETNVAIFQVRKKQKKKKNRKELRKECKGARENGRKGRREGVKKEINLDSRSSQDMGGGGGGEFLFTIESSHGFWNVRVLMRFRTIRRVRFPHW